MRMLQISLALTGLLGAATADPAETRHVRVDVGAQVTLTPGFAIGDVNGAKDSVAGFFISSSRRQITLIGRQPGTASVGLWDQRGQHRLTVSVTVMRELDGPTLQALEKLLEPYPAVSALMMLGRHVLSGTVDNADDLQVLRDVASALGIGCFVTVRPPPPVQAAVPGPARFAVEYDLRLLEADRHFASGAYDQGVEPSGRELYRTTVVASSDATAQTFIGGRAAVPAGKRGTAPPARPETGLRISLTPHSGPDGPVTTEVLIETNLPIASTVYDATEWRRFRQIFATQESTPLAIAGNDLLASPPPPARGSRSGNTARWIAKIAWLPRINGVPGANHIPVFSSLVGSEAYRKGHTQLVLFIRSRMAGRATE